MKGEKYLHIIINTVFGIICTAMVIIVVIGMLYSEAREKERQQQIKLKEQQQTLEVERDNLFNTMNRADDLQATVSTVHKKNVIELENDSEE